MGELTKEFYVARQPIFDGDQRLWGFELLFRDALHAEAACFEDADQATIAVSSCGFLRSTMGVSENAKIFINFTEELLLKRLPLALPASSTVIEILENVRVTPELGEALMELKNEGYVLALDDFTGDDSYGEILDYIDIIKCDCLGREVEDVIALKKKYERTSCMFLAEKVDSEEMYLALRESGFNLFQGYYFARPQLLEGKKITSQNLARIMLSIEIEKRELNLDAIIKAVKSDISLSYRLLLYINSSAFSFRNKIGSLKQALVLLGFKKIRHWLRLIIYSDLQDPDANPQAFVLALQRAYFLERLGALEPKAPYSPETFFLVGMFSLLEAMLRMPFEGVIDNLPLSQEIKDALLGKEGVLHDHLLLSQSMESGDFESLDALSQKIGLDENDVYVSFQEAALQAGELVEHLKVT